MRRFSARRSAAVFVEHPADDARIRTLGLSTILPSGRPRRSVPVTVQSRDRRAAPHAFPSARETRPLLVVADQKSEASHGPTRAADQVGLSAAESVPPVADDLPIALHRAQAALE